MNEPMSNICWDCANATRPDRCEWVEGFNPVPGWEAEPTAIKSTHSLIPTYHITACPKFVADPPRARRRGGCTERV